MARRHVWDSSDFNNFSYGPIQVNFAQISCDIQTIFYSIIRNNHKNTIQFMLMVDATTADRQQQSQRKK